MNKTFLTLLLSIALLSHPIQVCYANSESDQSPKKTTDISDLTSEETKELIELFKACDTTLEKCQKSHEDKDKLIQAQSEAIEKQVKTIEELKKSEDGILNNKTLWFIAGSLFTGGLFFLINQNK